MVETLPDAEAGQLFKALFRYGDEPKQPDGLSPLAFVAFQAMRPYLDENREKWEQTCAARAEAGRAGGYAKAANAAKLANAKFAKQNVANLADFDSENDTESELVPHIDEGNTNGASAAPASKGERKQRFTPPTIEEVAAYCNQRSNGIDPQAFIDFYESRNWMLSKGIKMSEWKAAIRTWEKRDRASGKAAPSSGDYSFDQSIFNQ